MFHGKARQFQFELSRNSTVFSQSGFHPSKLMRTMKLSPFTEKPALWCFRRISERGVIDFQQVNFYSNHKFKERMKTLEWKLFGHL